MTIKLTIFDTSAERKPGGPIIGTLSGELDDGTVIESTTDVGLAEKWARHLLPNFDDLPRGEQWQHTGDALREIRRAYDGPELDLSRDDDEDGEA